jgi:hypothetical protein
LEHGRTVMGHTRLPRVVRLLIRPAAPVGRCRQQQADKSCPRHRASQVEGHICCCHLQPTITEPRQQSSQSGWAGSGDGQTGRSLTARATCSSTRSRRTASAGETARSLSGSSGRANGFGVGRGWNEVRGPWPGWLPGRWSKGRPSSRRQISAMLEALSAVRGEAGTHRSGPRHEQRDALDRGDIGGLCRSCQIGHVQWRDGILPLSR